MADVLLGACLALVVKYITKRFIMEYDPYLGKTDAYHLPGMRLKISQHI